MCHMSSYMPHLHKCHECIICHICHIVIRWQSLFCSQCCQPTSVDWKHAACPQNTFVLKILLSPKYFCPQMYFHTCCMSSSLPSCCTGCTLQVTFWIKAATGVSQFYCFYRLGALLAVWRCRSSNSNWRKSLSQQNFGDDPPRAKVDNLVVPKWTIKWRSWICFSYDLKWLGQVLRVSMAPWHAAESKNVWHMEVCKSFFQC